MIGTFAFFASAKAFGKSEPISVCCFSMGSMCSTIQGLSSVLGGPAATGSATATLGTPARTACIAWAVLHRSDQCLGVFVRPEWGLQPGPDLALVRKLDKAGSLAR